MIIVKVILVFFIIFNFPIPGIYNSAILAIVISVFFYLSKPKLIGVLVSTFKARFVVGLFIIFLVQILAGVIPGIIHLTLDFSIIKPYILVLLIYTCTVIVYPLIVSDIPSEDLHRHVLYVLICCFVTQSVIEILAFTNSGVKDLVHFFQKEDVAAKDMGGIRALGLTGNPFFDLSTGFGLIYVVFFYYIITFSDSSRYFTLGKSITFILIFVGSFFAGRTAFVGLGAALALYFVTVKDRGKKIYSLVKLIAIIGVVSFVLYYVILPVDTKDVVENQLLPFAFEAVYNYLEDGDASTESGEVLERMYFPISTGTFIFGDGMYTGADGAYYLHTDAGIMRNLLFYGIGGLLLIFFAHCYYFYYPILTLIRSRKFREPFSSINSFIFLLIIFGYTIVLQYKGEVLLYMPIIQSMLFLVCFSHIQTHNLQRR